MLEFASVHERSGEAVQSVQNPLRGLRSRRLSAVPGDGEGSREAILGGRGHSTPVLPNRGSARLGGFGLLVLVPQRSLGRSGCIRGERRVGVADPLPDRALGVRAVAQVRVSRAFFGDLPRIATAFPQPWCGGGGGGGRSPEATLGRRDRRSRSPEASGRSQGCPVGRRAMGSAARTRDHGAEGCGG